MISEMRNETRGAQVCPLCNSREHEKLDTYKQRWYLCLQCGNARRNIREPFPLDHEPARSLVNLATGLIREPNRTRLRRRFVTTQGASEVDDAYALYAEACRLNYNETRWRKYDDEFLALLSEMSIDIAGKRVLSISDGPGFFAKRIADQCKEVVITEYNQVAVDGMRRELGINAVVYDFNTQKLSDVFGENRFDLIFLRSCIAFCTDLPSLANELAKVLAPDGIAYVFFHRPTLGICLQWMMHDDYISNFWYTPETMKMRFAEAGLHPLHSLSRFESAYRPQKRYPRSFKAKALFYPFWWYYFLKSKVSNAHFSSELNEVSYGVFFGRQRIGVGN
jgi:SAM-dependent methyltransferase